MKRRVDPVDSELPLAQVPIIDFISFGGIISITDEDQREGYKGRLFWAETGDLIYSKIRVKQGSMAVVPEGISRVAVSAEYPVYRVCEERADREYIELVLRTRAFLNFLDGLSHGSSSKTRIPPEAFEALKVPLPDKTIQAGIVAYWSSSQRAVAEARRELDMVAKELNDWLFARTKVEVFERAWLALDWADLKRWDVKTARAAAFRLAHPDFVPFATYAEDATKMVKPFRCPKHAWPVYGVNNKEGVFFSYTQPGAEFNAPYKRIRKDWFFHNPTRSAVGSLGHVPDVPKDAVTSPEYQVWKLRDLGADSLLPGFVAVLIRTKWFVRVIQFHRVGAVKQRLYVENLLEMPVPRFPRELQGRIGAERDAALIKLSDARKHAAIVRNEVEEMILGVREVPTTSK